MDRPPNDLGLYDDLADQWWDRSGAFAMLHWLAAARARLIPPATSTGSLLVDLGCGGGLLAPHVAGKGYTHIGVDMVPSALTLARMHGVEAIQADVTAVPLPDECAEVVSAGEILEHVYDLEAAVAEACRLLLPGGLLVLDTLADTALCRFIAITMAERVGGAPQGVHDPDLLVNPGYLIKACARNGVRLQIRGIRPSLRDLGRRALGQRENVRMLPTFTTAVLFQGRGVKL